MSRSGAAHPEDSPYPFSLSCPPFPKLHVRLPKETKVYPRIEEEFQIVDPVTRELRSHIEEILEAGKMVLKENVKPELHQSVVEVGTDICENVADARKSVTALRTDLAKLARNAGLRIAAAGTHPFSHWIDQKISKGERYQGVINDLQQVARANLIFGLHVHVGMPDRETAIQLMNTARYFLPHIFALSTNSPFWLAATPASRATACRSSSASRAPGFPTPSTPSASTTST